MYIVPIYVIMPQPLYFSNFIVKVFPSLFNLLHYPYTYLYMFITQVQSKAKYIKAMPERSFHGTHLSLP